MSILLGFVSFVAALLTLAVSATVFQLRVSDPAGNGLAQAFLAMGVVALWGTLAIVLAVVALRQQRYAMSWATINTADFRAHVILYGKNIPGFENVANLASLPPAGGFVVALPMKIEDGSGGPLRIVGYAP